MNLIEIAGDIIPNSEQILDAEFENLQKANTNVPYVSTAEYEYLLDDLAENFDKLGTIRQAAFKKFLHSELEAIEYERTLFPAEFNELFNDKEKDIKRRLSIIFQH
jgi:hypothetical protein